MNDMKLHVIKDPKGVFSSVYRDLPQEYYPLNN